MKLPIPKQFSILGHTINVVIDSKRMDDKNALGYLEPWLNKISLCNQSNGDSLPQDAIEHTYLHEVTHLILKCMGKDDLYKDEEFVDLFAGLLHQVLITSK